MRNFFVLLVMLSFHSAAFADSQKLNATQIIELLSDKTIYGLPGAAPSEQIFQKAGATYFTENGNQSQGEWKLEGDKYCSVWPPSQNWVCYDMTRDGNTIGFISPSGKISSYSLVK